MNLHDNATDDDLLTPDEADAIAATFRPRRPLKSTFEGHTRGSHAEREAEIGRPLTDRGGTMGGPIAPRGYVDIIKPPSAKDQRLHDVRKVRKPWVPRKQRANASQRWHDGLLLDLSYVWRLRADAYAESCRLRGMWLG